MAHYYTKSKNRTKLLLSFYFLLIFFVFCQYFNLQILNYQKYQLKAGNNSLRKIILKAPRGIIYDRNNKPIVDNKSIYDINLIPKDFNPDSFNYMLFNEIVDIEKENIDSVFLKNKSSISQFRPHLVKRNINFEKKSLLEENKLTTFLCLPFKVSTKPFSSPNLTVSSIYPFIFG